MHHHSFKYIPCLGSVASRNEKGGLPNLKAGEGSGIWDLAARTRWTWAGVGGQCRREDARRCGTPRTDLELPAGFSEVSRRGGWEAASGSSTCRLRQDPSQRDTEHEHAIGRRAAALDLSRCPVPNCGGLRARSLRLRNSRFPDAGRLRAAGLCRHSPVSPRGVVTGTTPW